MGTLLQDLKYGLRMLARNAGFPACLLPLTLTLTLGWLGCSGNKESEEPGPVVAVQIASVERRKVERKVTSEAVLFPLREAALAPKVSAPVRKFYVERGSRVRAGQLLAELENQDLAASATENQGAYEQAQAAYETATRAAWPEEIQKAELDLKAAKETMDAQQKVFKSRQMLYQQGATPRKDLDDASLSLTQARNQYAIAQKHLQSLEAVGKQQELKAAEGQLKAAKGRYLNAEAQLNYSQIRSPMDGVVTDRPYYAGEMASSGAPLITVMDLAQVVARAHLSPPQAAGLKAGDPARISAPGVEGEIAGQVTMVSPALDPNSSTVEVWAQAANPGGRLRPGTSVRLTLVAETTVALVVPVIAVQTGEDGTTSVMVVDSNGRPRQKTVQTGIRDGENAQIIEGLQPGERVVTAGAYELYKLGPDVLEKTKVKVEAPKSEEAVKGKG